MKTLSYGEILWDKIAFVYHIGGAPFNFAAHLALCGAESYFLSALGQDPLGDKAFEEVLKKGLKADFLCRNALETGIVEVKLSQGIPQYDILKNRAWDKIEPDAAMMNLILGTKWDLFYLGSLAQRSSFNKDWLHNTCLPALKADDIFFDVNLRQHYYDRELLDKTLKYCSILKLNDEEYPIITRVLLQEVPAEEKGFMQLQQNYPQLKMMILTRGKEGATIYNKEGVHHFKSKEDVSVADTVGAGDSFSAAFSFAWHQSKDLEKAAGFALKVADWVVSNSGALPLYSKEIQKELESFQN